MNRAKYEVTITTAMNGEETSSQVKKVVAYDKDYTTLINEIGQYVIDGYSGNTEKYLNGNQKVSLTRLYNGIEISIIYFFEKIK